MSPEADVMEMQSLCAEIADRAGASREKERIDAVRRQLGVGWNRALEFLRGKARRVDSWEKDHARRNIEELRRRAAIDHIANLNRTLAYLKTTDPDGYGAHVDAMERSLVASGLLARPLAETTNTTKGDE